MCKQSELSLQDDLCKQGVLLASNIIILHTINTFEINSVSYKMEVMCYL